MPPPASNESQGLKIAVIIFVVLFLIMSVTTYLGYDSASQAAAKEASAKKAADEATRKLAEQTRNAREVRGWVWGPEGEKTESHADLDARNKTNLNKIKDRTTEIAKEIREKVAAAQAKGLNRKEVADLAESIDEAVQRLSKEQTVTLESRISTLLDLLRLQASQATELALDNVDLRSTLEGVNASNDVRVKNAEQKLAQAVAEKQAADAKHEQDRQELVAKLDKVNTINAEQAQQITNLKSELDKTKTAYDKQLALLRAINRENQEQIRKNETFLDKRDATITYVDRTRREVHTSLTRGMGARPQLRFSIFDRGAHGLPTDKPKATIELTYVGDNGSVGKVVKQVDYADPIRPGDQVYSPTWDPNHPLHFALIGRIDINRDGNDDRDALKRLIEISGGVVDYDLPPPGQGSEKGQITPRIDYYVMDDSKSVFGGGLKAKNANEKNEAYLEMRATEDKEFIEKKSAAEKLARDNNLRPMSVEKLLAWLGYTYNQPLPGRPEARNAAVGIDVQGGVSDAVRGSDANANGGNAAKPDDMGQKPGDDAEKKKDEDETDK